MTLGIVLLVAAGFAAGMALSARQGGMDRNLVRGLWAAAALAAMLAVVAFALA